MRDTVFTIKEKNRKFTSLLVLRQYPLVLLTNYAVGNAERWEDKKVRLWGMDSWITLQRIRTEHFR